MAYVIQEQTLTDIADAIREKTGKTDAMTPLQMPDEILSIQGGDSEWDAEPPDDGKMRLYIEIPDPPSTWEGEWPYYSIKVNLVMAYPYGSIDWGDGILSTSFSKHTYEQGGKYIITVTPNEEGTENITVQTNAFAGIIKDPNESKPDSQYCHMLKKAYMNTPALNLSSFISRGYCFYKQYGLEIVELPQGLTSTGEYTLQYCHFLSRLSLPESLQTLERNSLYDIFSLYELVLPSTVTQIKATAIYFSWSSPLNPPSLRKLYLKSVVPPILEASDAISGLPDNAIIYVPKGTLEAYQTATNWSTYADQMQEWEVPEA